MSDQETPEGNARRPRLTPAMADVRRAVRSWGESVTPGLYLVGLSGGGDSVALAWAASAELPGLGFRVGAVVVDHQLQPESARIAHEARENAEALGLAPVLVKTVQVSKGSGPEDAARAARYQAFVEALNETGALGILLAHSEDDQAETVLMGLVRGSGPSSLKGMAPSDGTYHRPLLGLPRSTLRAALEDQGMSWWEDPHNDDESFLRVRVRKNLMPILEQEMGPGVASALSRTAELFRQDSTALDDLAKRVFDHSVTHDMSSASCAISALAAQPEAIASRVVRLMVLHVGGAAPTYAQMAQTMALVFSWRGQSALALAGASVERSDGTLVVRSTR